MSRQLFFVVLFLNLCCFLSCRKISAIKLFSWNMGSGHCVGSESYPNCDSYIVGSVSKLINLAGQYDILCLQEFPKYKRGQQRRQADRVVEQIALKHKFSILRKQNSDIAILSRFPVLEMDYLDLSQHYGAQRIKFKLGNIYYQIVNVHLPWQGIVSDINIRKDDLRKVWNWMSNVKNKADINIFAGDLNLDQKIVYPVYDEVKPFGGGPTPNIFVNGIDYIFVFGGDASKSSLGKKDMDNNDHQYATTLSQNLPNEAQYMQNLASHIRTTHTNYGNVAYLAVNGIVYGGDYRRAFFGDGDYVRADGKYRFKFILENLPNGRTRISCPYDAVSYLVQNKKIQRGDSYEYQWAYWQSWDYIQGYSRSEKDLTFLRANDKIEANYQEPAFLSPNRRISNDDYQWAFFGTRSYIDGSSRYNSYMNYEYL